MVSLYYIDTNYIYYILGKEKPSESIERNVLKLQQLKNSTNIGLRTDIVCVPSSAVYEYFVANKDNDDLQSDILSFFSKECLLQSTNLFPLESDEMAAIANMDKKARIKVLSNVWLTRKITFESQILTHIGLSIATSVTFAILNQDKDGDIGKAIADLIYKNIGNLLKHSFDTLSVFYLSADEKLKSAESFKLFERFFFDSIYIFSEIFAKKNIQIPSFESFSGSHTFFTFCGSLLEKKDFAESFDNNISPSLLEKGWTELGISYLKNLEERYLFSHVRFRKNDIMDLAWILSAPQTREYKIFFCTGDKKVNSFLSAQNLNLS